MYTNPDLIHGLNTAAGRRVDKRSEVKVSSCKEKERQAEPLVRERKRGETRRQRENVFIHGHGHFQWAAG